MKFLKILHDILEIFSMLLEIFELAKNIIVKNNFYYNMFKIFYAPYKYVKFILKTSMGYESYEKIIKIYKNKKISDKIMIENYFFIKNRYPFFIANTILLIFYAFVLFSTTLDKNTSFFLSVIILSMMLAVCGLDLRSSLKKGIIEKVFVEEKVNTILDKIIKIIKNWLKK